MQRLITGIKPTGSIHLGNYFSAIRPMVERQAEYECLLFVADVHALNQVSEAETLRAQILETAKAYLACGLDPERVTLFQQSVMPNAEIALLIGAQVGLGHLERAHAFKDAKANGRQVNFGLFSYPILMAADILAYQAEVVPVGVDQHQHLEMAREIAEQVNNRYGQLFVLPQALATTSPTIPGLDGRKMSKSYENVIGLFEAPEEIRKKVMRIVTDSKAPEEPKNPEQDTIMQLYRLVAAPDAADALADHYRRGGLSYREAKEILADALVTYLQPIQERKAELDTQEDMVKKILADGAAKARPLAEASLLALKQKLGLTL